MFDVDGELEGAFDGVKEDDSLDKGELLDMDGVREEQKSPMMNTLEMPNSPSLSKKLSSLE